MDGTIAMIGLRPSLDAGALGPRRSLPEAIADSVAESIALGRIRPGERVVEVTLTQALGVSRVPTREALKVLHTQGILVGGGYKGLFVADFGPAMVARVFELRLTLESFLLRDAIVKWRNKTSDFNALRGKMLAIQRAARAGDVARTRQADLDFHRAVCAAADNAITATLWEAIARHVLIIFSLEGLEEGDLAGVVSHHEAFLAFMEAQVARGGGINAIRRGVEAHLLTAAKGAALQDIRCRTNLQTV